MTSIASPLQALCLEHLEQLKATTKHLRLAVVALADGFPLAQIDTEASTGRKAAAMASALGGLASSVVKEFSLGLLEGTILECDQGLVFCRQIKGPKRSFILFMIMDDKATYGHALWAIKNAAKNISEALHAQPELGTTL